MHKQTVQFACGHTKAILLSSLSSEQARLETVAFLERSFCFTCHRRQRQAFSLRVRDAFGLTPLVGSDSLQLSLAEEVRIHLLETLFPTIDPGNQEAVTALFTILNRQTTADFWLEHRMVLWSWNKQRIATVLLDLFQLQAQEVHT